MNTILTEKEQKLLEKRLLEEAEGNELLCEKAFALANELEIPTIEVGRAADTLGIKVRNCQLGCF